jgi:transcriptional regulator with XRE-family HTH domain
MLILLNGINLQYRESRDFPNVGEYARLPIMKSKDRAFTQKLKDKLLTEMTRQGLNGQRLAQRSKVSDSEISRILSGQSTPGLENAFRLARAVNVSVDFLADDSLDADPLTATDSVSPDERRVLDVVEQLGLTRAILLLENIRYIGFETSMKRLLMTGKPSIELDRDEEARPAPAAPVSPMPAPRSGTTG